MARIASIALALVVSAGALTACGVRSTVDPVAAAATKTEKAGGVDVTLTSSFGTAARTLTMTGHGAFDGQEGELQVDLSGLLPQSGGLGASGLEERFLTEDGDPVIYLDFPLFSAMLGGKTWMRIDLQKAGKAVGVDVSQLMKGSGQNPADMLALLRASGRFAEVGKETTGGVDTTHYHGTVDIRKAVEKSGISSELANRLADLGAPTEVPYDVWVDGRGLLRKVEQSYDQTLGGITTTYRTTVEYSHYGRDVSVTAPPADDVFDVTGMAAGAGGTFPGTTTTHG